MTKHSLLVSYNLKWRHRELHHYVYTDCGKLINLKTNRVIKRSLNGYSQGYWIGRKFLTTLKNDFELIPEIKEPF